MYLPLAWIEFLQKNPKKPKWSCSDFLTSQNRACRNFGMSSTYLSRDSVSLGFSTSLQQQMGLEGKSRKWNPKTGWGGWGGGVFWDPPFDERTVTGTETASSFPRSHVSVEGYVFVGIRYWRCRIFTVSCRIALALLWHLTSISCTY